MTINKDFIDQPLHVLAGAVLVIGFSFITSLWMAALISAATGLVREIYQRYDQDRAWYDFGAGSRLDMIFWFLGTAIGVAIMFFPATNVYMTWG
jgi:hypothetical protein